MVSKYFLKSNGYSNIEEYFDAINIAKLDGLEVQAKRLIANLSPEQKQDFFNHKK